MTMANTVLEKSVLIFPTIEFNWACCNRTLSWFMTGHPYSIYHIQIHIQAIFPKTVWHHHIYSTSLHYSDLTYTRICLPTLASYFKSHAERLEAVQWRALNITVTFILPLAGIPTLQAWRLHFSFFRKVCQPNNCLHHLLPPHCDPAMTSRLYKPTVYPRPNLHTKWYCSTISYGLQNFQ